VADSFGFCSNRLQGLNIIIVLRALLFYIYTIQGHFRPSRLGPESSFWLVLQAKL
jgi:hypothetical protein